MGGKGDSLGIVHNSEFILENEAQKIQMNQLLSTRWPDLVIVNKKKRTCWTVDFAISDDHRAKLKESKKRDKFLDLAREVKKLWHMKETVILMVFCMLSTVTKGLVQGQEDLEIRKQVKTIYMTALFRLARILRRVLETWGDLLLFKLQWKTLNRGK